MHSDRDDRLRRRRRGQPPRPTPAAAVTRSGRLTDDTSTAELDEPPSHARSHHLIDARLDDDERFGDTDDDGWNDDDLDDEDAGDLFDAGWDDGDDDPDDGDDDDPDDDTWDDDTWDDDDTWHDDGWELRGRRTGAQSRWAAGVMAAAAAAVALVAVAAMAVTVATRDTDRSVCAETRSELRSLIASTVSYQDATDEVRGEVLRQQRQMRANCSFNDVAAFEAGELGPWIGIGYTGQTGSAFPTQP